MIDLNEFNRISTAQRGRSRDESCVYLAPKPSKDGSRNCCICLRPALVKEYANQYGYKCNVFWNPDRETFIIAYGNDRKLVAPETGQMHRVSIGYIRSELIRRYGEFERLYLNDRWDNDQRGNLIVVLEFNGRIDRRKATS